MSDEQLQELAIGTPSDEQLQELAIGTPNESSQEKEDPLKDMPDPEPHVVERAQKLVDDMQQGKKFSQVIDSEKKEKKRAEKSDDIPKKSRVEFLAHILEGVPFRKTYEFFDRKFTVTFRTLSKSEEAQLLKIIAAEEVPQPQQEQVFFQLLLAASIESYTVEGKKHRIAIFGTVAPEEDPLERYREWMTETSRERYQILKRAHKQFRRLLAIMIEEAGSPDFWKSLS